MLGTAFSLFRLLIRFISERKLREFHFKPVLETVLGTEIHCWVDIKSVWELNFRYQKFRNFQGKKTENISYDTLVLMNVKTSKWNWFEPTAASDDKDAPTPQAGRQPHLAKSLNQNNYFDSLFRG